VQTVTGWLDKHGDDAGYRRARELFMDQPAAARTFGDLLSNPQAKIPEHTKRSRADVKLPDTDALETARSRLLRLTNRRNATRLQLKAIHDATTSGRPVPVMYRGTFERAGKVAR
jgi:hypothetical protein